MNIKDILGIRGNGDCSLWTPLNAEYAVKSPKLLIKDVKEMNKNVPS